MTNKMIYFAYSSKAITEGGQSRNNAFNEFFKNSQHLQLKTINLFTLNSIRRKLLQLYAKQ